MGNQVVKRKLTEFKPDERNANKHTLRGMAMLEDSLQQLGAGRSILVDRNNNVIAGNATLETAVQTGFDEALVIPTDGKQLVIVQRVDIDLNSPQGRKLALFDNRSAELDLAWSADELTALADDGIDLSQFFDEDELAALLNTISEDDFTKTSPDVVPSQYMILIECDNERTQADLLERFADEGLKCRALLS